MVKKVLGLVQSYLPSIQRCGIHSLVAYGLPKSEHGLMRPAASTRSDRPEGVSHFSQSVSSVSQLFWFSKSWISTWVKKVLGLVQSYLPSIQRCGIHSLVAYGLPKSEHGLMRPAASTRSDRPEGVSHFSQFSSVSQLFWFSKS